MTAPSGGQLISTEQVLEKLFRAGYNRWVEDARKWLGPDNAVAAPRVVSKAFHLAWTDRQRLHSQDELDAFLGANIQHGAARELSRKAGAARMAHGEGHKEVHDQHLMTVDEAWERLSHTLKGGTPESYRQRASTARHETAEHFSRLADEKFNWKPLVAIGAIGIAIGVGGFMYVESAGADRAITHALNAQDARPYETSFGQQANVTLDDSTVVRIGPETKLIVPKMFNIDLRAVKIEGTANFDVTRAMEQKFEVRSGQVAIIGAGSGMFTVRRFRDDSMLVIHARKGALDVRFGETTHSVAEGFSLMVSSTGAMTVPSAEQLAEASSWVDGNIAIEGRSLRDALPQLKRWFGLDIKVPDAALLDRRVFIRAAMGSSKEAISAIEQSGGLKFTYIGENMAFQDTLPSRGRGTKTKGR